MILQFAINWGYYKFYVYNEYIPKVPDKNFNTFEYYYKMYSKYIFSLFCESTITKSNKVYFCTFLQFCFLNQSIFVIFLVWIIIIIIIMKFIY